MECLILSLYIQEKVWKKFPLPLFSGKAFTLLTFHDLCIRDNALKHGRLALEA